MTTTPPEPDQPAGAQLRPPPAPERPRSIALAVRLMWTGAALAALSIVYTLASRATLKDRVTEQLRDSDPAATASEIDALYAISIVSGLAGGVIAIGLWAWMAWKNGQGRAWARVVATVLAAINLLGVPFSVVTARGQVVTLAMTAVNVVLAIVILVLLWRKESTTFYQGTAASRRLY